MLRTYRAKRAFLSLVVTLMLTGVVRAQPKFVRSDFEFTAVAPPVSLSWQLATPGGEHVDLAIAGIEPAAGSPLIYIITPANASQFGVDFPAWSLAVNDPTYSRSIMTWAGVTKEQPVVRNFPLIELDDLRVFVNDYRWPDMGGGLPFVNINAFAFDAPIVPEPASWLLALAATIWLSIRPNQPVPAV